MLASAPGHPDTALVLNLFSQDLSLITIN